MASPPANFSIFLAYPLSSPIRLIGRSRPNLQPLAVLIRRAFPYTQSQTDLNGRAFQRWFLPSVRSSAFDLVAARSSRPVQNVGYVASCNKRRHDTVKIQRCSSFIIHTSVSPLTLSLVCLLTSSLSTSGLMAENGVR